MKRLSIFFFFLSLCLFASCVKEFDDTTVTPGEVGVPKIVVYSNIAGHVMSNDRRQMAGATVQIDDVATTTDMYGNFRLENVPMNGYGQLVKISKEGFFDQYKLVYPEIENNAEIRAILIDKRFIQEFQSDEGGDIVGNKLSINFAPNSIVDSQNQPFQGAVKVFQAPLNPNDKNFDFIVPGNLRSIDENGDDVILQSFAMSVIKLESTDGEPLNIKEGNTAQLTFEIPDTHIDQAPESIPLWYFNEDTG